MHYTRTSTIYKYLRISSPNLIVQRKTFKISAFSYLQVSIYLGQVGIGNSLFKGILVKQTTLQQFTYTFLCSIKLPNAHIYSFILPCCPLPYIVTHYLLTFYLPLHLFPARSQHAHTIQIYRTFRRTHITHAHTYIAECD